MVVGLASGSSRRTARDCWLSALWGWCCWSGADLLVKEQKESLGNFLESCDLVKFAKYEPGEDELLGLHGSAVKLVEETEPQPESMANAEDSALRTPHSALK